MDALNLVFCILCIVCGILTMIGAILWMTVATSFVSVVLGIYLMFVFFSLFTSLCLLFHDSPSSPHSIFSLYIIVVEIFMPSKLRSLMAFYLTWTGKAVSFIFIAVLLIIPFENKAKHRAYYLVAAIYLFVVAAILIVLQVIGCLGKISSRSHPIINKEEATTTSK